MCHGVLLIICCANRAWGVVAHLHCLIIHDHAGAAADDDGFENDSWKFPGIKMSLCP